MTIELLVGVFTLISLIVGLIVYVIKISITIYQNTKTATSNNEYILKLEKRVESMEKRTNRLETNEKLTEKDIHSINEAMQEVKKGMHRIEMLVIRAIPKTDTTEEE